MLLSRLKLARRFSSVACFGEGNRGVDRSAGAFDVLRVLHAALECFTHIDEGGGEQGAEQGGDDDDQRLVRLDRVFRVCRGVVDDAHVTYGAGADDVQLPVLFSSME